MKFLPIMLLALVGCKEIPDALDLSLSAEEGKDATAIFEGCGVKTDGYLFCRVWEESSTDREIKIHLPKVECDRDNCVEIQIINLDGSPGMGVGVPKGSTEASFKLSQMLNSDEVDRSHDGEYRVLARTYFKGPDGIQRQSRFSGAFRLWVLKKNYQRVVCNDPERGWTKDLNKNCTAEYTTSMRAALCGECK